MNESRPPEYMIVGPSRAKEDLLLEQQALLLAKIEQAKRVIRKLHAPLKKQVEFSRTIDPTQRGTSAAELVLQDIGHDLKEWL